MAVKRRQHYLKRNRKSEFPYHTIFVDTETLPEYQENGEMVHNFRLGVACYWRRQAKHTRDTIEWKEFTSPDTFWHWLDDKAKAGRRIVIVAHNLIFDAQVLEAFSWLARLEYESIKIISDAHRQIWKFRRGKATLLFLDNMNYFNTSLASLGESLKFPKDTMPDFNAPDEVWFPYCRRDVEVMLTAWQTWYKFLTDNDLGNWSFTLASQAFNAYCHRFMPVDIGIHTSNNAVELERKAYHGGRVECFALGVQPEADYYMVDINSMYPAVMRWYDYPRNLTNTGGEMTIEDLAKYLKHKAVIADVLLETPEPAFALRHKDRLYFPTGTFWTTLTTRELMLALERGYIRRIRRFAMYDKANLFEKYVDYFYGERLKYQAAGNTAFSYMCKILLNSLYGKFGQKLSTWTGIGYYPDVENGAWVEVDAQTHKTYTYRCINHQLEYASGVEEGYNSLVAIAAEVTANASLYLYRLFEQAGIRNVYYCDTDSLIINQAGYDNLAAYLDKSRLGYLKLECKARNLELHGAKDYVIGDKYKLKGISKKAKKIMPGIYRQYQSRGLNSSLRHNSLNKAVWSPVVKAVTRTYRKGAVLSDGSVEPVIFAELNGYNWLVEDYMLASYGNTAEFCGRPLCDELLAVSSIGNESRRKYADLSPAQRAAAEEEEMIKRRNGDMIYQRGRNNVL